MDDVAERGAAAHFLYKDKEIHSLLSTQEQRLLGNIMHVDTPRDASLVCCLTRDHDVMLLPTNSTILEVAYRIHSGLGMRATGAQVSGKDQSISYKVQDGDRVHIYAAAVPQICQEWLQYIQDTSIYKKIHGYLKSTDNL